MRVLVVEDEPIVAMDLAAFLEEKGCEVVGPFDDLSYVLAMIRARPDAAVLDVKIANERSFDLAAALLRRGVNVVFTTGYDASIIPAALRGCALVPKPMDLAALWRALKADAPLRLRGTA